MSSGCNEVQTGMDARVVITVQGALDLQFFLKVGLKLCVDELHNRFVAANGNKQSNEIKSKIMIIVINLKNE